MNFLQCFLLLSAALHSSWNVSYQTFVHQSRDVAVPEGETVTITCCWNKSDRVRLQWLKNQKPIKSETFINHSEGSMSEQKEMFKCSNLSIENIKRRDSGRYICKIIVEIPVLIVYEGNSTKVTVLGIGPTENPADSTDADRHHTAEEEEERTDEEAERKTDDSSNTKIVDELVPSGDEEAIETHKEKTADRTVNHIAIDGSEEKVLTFVLRSLPVLALITAFFWLYCLGIKAQRENTASAAPGNKAPSQNVEEEQEEEEEKKGVRLKRKEKRKEMNQFRMLSDVKDLDWVSSL